MASVYTASKSDHRVTDTGLTTNRTAPELTGSEALRCFSYASSVKDAAPTEKIRACLDTHCDTHAHTRTHAHTHTQTKTHTQKQNITHNQSRALRQINYSTA